MNAMDEKGLKRKDTTRGPPLRILSLDGGGVRGYSMLILLQELMHKVFNEAEGRAPRRDEIPKPCEYFDLIAGTGTGGLIAIMLGRLRLDLETCKEVYIRMTRKVFETDKTIFGMPYRSSLFKASKLEEAIKECVREHTIYMTEGNDGTTKGGREAPVTFNGTKMTDKERRASIASSIGSNSNPRSPASAYVTSMRWGNANASLYDARENRCKTAVTAVYKDTDPKTGGPTLLRSYDSRNEPPPEFNCTIWQAGRATSAIGLSFKPIQIGTSVFVDEGAGKYNPSPQIMDEAVLNEWPGREVGAFVSIGTGKRPSNSGGTKQDWWEGFVGGNMGDFAEFRRTLIQKIEACEETHQYMRTEHLSRRGVNPEHYYRINVEVGVGDFGMNEWSRVSDISTSTRLYLARAEVKTLIDAAAAKMARIERARRRHEPVTTTAEMGFGEVHPALRTVPSPPNPLVVELPGDDGREFGGAAKLPKAYALSTPDEKFAVLSPNDVPLAARRSNESRRYGDSRYGDGRHGDAVSLESRSRYEDARSSASSFVPSPRRSHESDGVARSELAGQSAPPVPPQIPHTPPPPPLGVVEAPPRPPKTPIQPRAGRGGSSPMLQPQQGSPPLPYGSQHHVPSTPQQPSSQNHYQFSPSSPQFQQNPQLSPTSPHFQQTHFQQNPQLSPVSPQEMQQRASVASSLVSPHRFSGGSLPYPDDDGPPPVDMAAKPKFVGR